MRQTHSSIELLALLLIVVCMSACRDSSFPPKETLTEAVESRFGQAWEFNGFDIVAEENVGTDTNPIVETRFEGALSVRSDAFEGVRSELRVDDTICFIRTDRNDEYQNIPLTGLITSILSGFEWTTSVEIENEVNAPEFLTSSEIEQQGCFKAIDINSSEYFELQSMSAQLINEYVQSRNVEASIMIRSIDHLFARVVDTANRDGIARRMEFNVTEKAEDRITGRLIPDWPYGPRSEYEINLSIDGDNAQSREYNIENSILTYDAESSEINVVSSRPPVVALVLTGRGVAEVNPVTGAVSAYRGLEPRVRRFGFLRGEAILFATVRGPGNVQIDNRLDEQRRNFIEMSTSEIQ